MSAVIQPSGFSSRPLPGSGFELIQTSSPGNPLPFQDDTHTLYSELRRSGVLIFRGFSVDLDSFDDFVSRHSSRVTVDAARKSSTANTAEIDAGLLEMGLHRENGNLPFSPDLQWFYCLTPARQGSETTVCDGSRALFNLPGRVRRQFEERKIKYSRRIPWANVRRFFSVELRIPLERVDETHLEFVNDTVPGQFYRRIDNDLIHSELTTDAIITSRFSGKPAFCNSLLGPSVNYEPPSITWENGDDIDFDAWDELKAATALCTFELFWEKGDVVVLDNTRVMHGRRRIADPSRRIFGAQSYRQELAS